MVISWLITVIFHVKREVLPKRKTRPVTDYSGLQGLEIRRKHISKQKIDKLLMHSLITLGTAQKSLVLARLLNGLEQKLR